MGCIIDQLLPHGFLITIIPDKLFRAVILIYFIDMTDVIFIQKITQEATGKKLGYVFMKCTGVKPHKYLRRNTTAAIHRVATLCRVQLTIGKLAGVRM